MRRARAFCLAGLVATAVISSAGCLIAPFSMGLATPIPIQPWVADSIEERFMNKNDHRAPVMPPIPPGHRPLCEDLPDRAEILRAMPRVTRGIPYIYEEFRDDIDFNVEKLVDSVDPPRFYPLVGPAQLHHCHFKCTIFYTETVESSYPLPFRTKKRRIQVVYIDKDHLHLFMEGDEARQAITRDLTMTRP